MSQNYQWLYLSRVDRESNDRDLRVKANVYIEGQLFVNDDPVDGEEGEGSFETLANKDPDPALAANSDDKYPTQKAVKTAIGLAVAAVSGNIPAISALVFGGVVIWESEYTFRVSAASYFIQGDLYSSAEQSITLDPADADLDRIDVLVLDTVGTLQKITGVAASQPSEPDFDPSTQLKLTFAFVAANTTQPVNVSNENLYLNNTEWTSSTNGSGWNANSTNNPRSGARTIEGTNVANNAYVQLQRSSSLSLDAFSTLSLFARSKATFGNNRVLRLQWFLDGVAKGTALTLASGYWGFDSSQVSSYQLIAIPLSQFVLPAGQLVNQFRISDVGGAVGVYIDDVVLQVTATDLSVPPVGISQAQADTRYLQYPTARSVAGTYTVLTTDDIIIAEVAGGGFSLNLHAVAQRARSLVVKVRKSGGANMLTLDPNGSETVDGESTMQLAPGDMITLIKDPSSTTNWETI